MAEVAEASWPRNRVPELCLFAYCRGSHTTAVAEYPDNVEPNTQRSKAPAPFCPWSSYWANALAAQDPLLSPHALYRRLGRSVEVRQSSYRQLFRAQLSKADIEAIRESTNKAWALGNAHFQAKIAALAGRRAAPMPKERPVKNDL